MPRLPKPKQRFARVNFEKFVRLRDEVVSYCGEAGKEGEIIAERLPGDRRVTAFAGWSEGRSSRDLFNRYRFAMGQRDVTAQRLVYVLEEAYRALCTQERIEPELLRLEHEQQPIPVAARIQQRAQQQELCLVVAEAAEIDRRVADATRQQTLRMLREVRRGVVRPLSIMEGASIVTQPTIQQVRERVLLQMAMEELRKRRGSRGRVSRVPAAQLKLF